MATVSISNKDFLTNELLGNKNILIFSKIVNGLGDISCGFKVARFLRDKLQISSKQITIATNEVEKAESFNISDQFPLISENEINKIQNLAFQIIVPATGLNPCPRKFLIYGTPLLIIYEYGFENKKCKPFLDPWITTKSLGVNTSEGEIGIFIDEELEKWSLSNESKDSLKRKEKLNELEPVLQHAILEKPDHLLYFGYTHETKTNSRKGFIEALLTFNQKNSHNLIIILPGFLGKEFNDPKWLQGLNSLGMLRFEFFHYDAESKKVELLQEQDFPTGIKTVRVIRGKVNTKTMRILWIASEKEIVATGDQTFSEATSADKSIAYETMLHKMPFAKNLQQRDRFHKKNVRIETFKKLPLLLQSSLIGEGDFSEQSQKFLKNVQLCFFSCKSEEDLKKQTLDFVEDKKTKQKDIFIIDKSLTFNDKTWLQTLNQFGIKKTIAQNYNSEKKTLETLCAQDFNSGNKTLTILTGFFTEIEQTILKINSKQVPTFIGFADSSRSIANEIYNTFFWNRFDRYESSTLFNRGICTNFNCLPNLEKCVQSILKNQTSFNFNDKLFKTSFSPEEIPYDEFILLDDVQLDSLKINLESDQSALTALHDSIFDVTWLDRDLNLIRRRKVTSAVS